MFTKEGDITINIFVFHINEHGFISIMVQKKKMLKITRSFKFSDTGSNHIYTTDHLDSVISAC